MAAMGPWARSRSIASYAGRLHDALAQIIEARFACGLNAPASNWNSPRAAALSANAGARLFSGQVTRSRQRVV